MTASVPLVDLPGNPLPPGVEVATVETRDGVALRAAGWAGPPEASRGTVYLLQGRAEFVEKYFEVVGELRGRGYDVVAFDWRGQGGSHRGLADRHKGHVRHFDDFRHDYEAVRARFPAAAGRPAVVLAHSMGGCLALTAAAEGWLAADRLVALAPMLSLSIVKHARLAGLLARALAGLGLAERYVPGGQAESISRLPFEGNRLCQDRVRYDRNGALAAALDWGAVGSPTIGWLRAADEAMARLARRGVAGAIEVPTLVVAAGADPVCSTPAIALFARALRRGTLVEIPGARHELLMETDAIRAQLWRAVDAFLADPEHPEPAGTPGATAIGRGAIG